MEPTHLKSNVLRWSYFIHDCLFISLVSIDDSDFQFSMRILSRININRKLGGKECNSSQKWIRSHLISVGFTLKNVRSFL